jgi:RNA polymerase sigma-70 factor (ECF subfamily)
LTTFEISALDKAAYTEQVFLGYYDEYFPRVYQYIRYRCNDPHIADDLTANVFEKALANFHHYSPRRGPFGGWLFAIARNVVNAHLRSTSQRWSVSIEKLQEQACHNPLPEEAIISVETQSELIVALEGLSPRERDLLGLKFGAQLTNRQISALTGLTESNVGIILYRALHKLRGLLNSRGEIG